MTPTVMESGTIAEIDGWPCAMIMPTRSGGAPLMREVPVIAPAPYNVHLQPVHTHLAAHAIRAMSFNLVKSSQVKSSPSSQVNLQAHLLCMSPF